MPIAKFFNIKPNQVDISDKETKGIEQNTIEYFGYSLGLKASQTLQSASSIDGRIWSIMAVGLACYDGVRFDTFGRGRELQNHILRALEIDAENNLWLGSNLGIEILDISGSKPSSISFHKLGRINCIKLDNTQAIFGGSKGLFQKKHGGEIVPFDGPGLRNQAVEALLLPSNGDIWAIGSTIGVFKIKKGEKTEIKIPIPPE